METLPKNKGKQSLLHPNVGTAKSKCHLMKTPFSVSSGRLIPDTAVAQRPVMGGKVRGLPLTQRCLPVLSSLQSKGDGATVGTGSASRAFGDNGQHPSDQVNIPW